MKANEAPEKIYLQQYDENTLICLNKYNISEEWSNKPCNEKVAINIEYTRIDSFIEKACFWLKENKDKYLYNTGDKGEYIPTCSGKMIEDFEKYMKG
jgi:hypothetical protein